MSKGSIDFSNLGAQFKGLEAGNIGNWPPLAKAVMVLFVCGLVSGALYWFFIMPQLDELNAARIKEQTLKLDYEAKAGKAANLPAYTQQMQQMKEAFKDLLRQLPKSAEVPGLVDEISYAGSGAGLVFNKVELQKDEKKEFIVEAPISITVTGGYHQLGEFISKVSALPRIVTIHNFTIKSTAKAGDTESSDNLSMDVIAKTYRYESAEGEK